jgi:hypothetical protein
MEMMSWPLKEYMLVNMWGKHSQCSCWFKKRSVHKVNKANIAIAISYQWPGSIACVKKPIVNTHPPSVQTNDKGKKVMDGCTGRGFVIIEIRSDWATTNLEMAKWKTNHVLGLHTGGF